MPPTIPPILTKGDWDKQKGLIAKMAGETGIGAQMDKVQAAYNAVDWAKFDAKMQVQAGKDPELVDKALAAAKAEYSKIELVRKELRVLEDLAKKAEARFKSNPVIPKSSTEHVAKIAKAADQMAVALKSMDAEFKGFVDLKANLVNLQQTSRKALDSYVGKIPSALSKVKSQPTKDNFDAFWKEYIRGLSAALSLQKDLASHASVWKNMSGDGFKPTKDDPKVIKDKITQVESAFNKLKSAL